MSNKGFSLNALQQQQRLFHVPREESCSSVDLELGKEEGRDDGSNMSQRIRQRGTRNPFFPNLVPIDA